MRKIAQKLKCEPSNITGIVDRLEARGLVERRPDPADRRVKLAAPTEEGADTARAAAGVAGLRARAAGGAADEERTVLRELLQADAGRRPRVSRAGASAGRVAGRVGSRPAGGGSGGRSLGRRRTGPFPQDAAASAVLQGAAVPAVFAPAGSATGGRVPAAPAGSGSSSAPGVRSPRSSVRASTAAQAITLAAPRTAVWRPSVKADRAAVSSASPAPARESGGDRGGAGQGFPGRVGRGPAGRPAGRASAMSRAVDGGADAAQDRDAQRAAELRCPISSSAEAEPARSGGAAPMTSSVPSDITTTRPAGVDPGADQHEPQRESGSQLGQHSEAGRGDQEPAGDDVGPVDTPLGERGGRAGRPRPPRATAAGSTARPPAGSCRAPICRYWVMKMAKPTMANMASRFISDRAAERRGGGTAPGRSSGAGGALAVHEDAAERPAPAAMASQRAAAPGRRAAISLMP